MKLEYLNNNCWADITRDERYFCAELFFHFKNNPVGLINLLIKANISKECVDENDLNMHWELGFEVCFYRDLIYDLNIKRNEKIKIDDYSRKRTFDLCLFSQKKILIIEAKAQSGFNTAQMNDFGNDEKHFKKLREKEGISLPPEHYIGLAADTYYNNVRMPGKSGIPKLFDERHFSWMDIYNYTEKDIFLRANELYKN